MRPCSPGALGVEFERGRRAFQRRPRPTMARYRADGRCRTCEGQALRGAARSSRRAGGMTRRFGIMVNWVCFVKLLRIDHPVPVYINVDVHRDWCRDPFASPYRLAAQGQIG